MGKLVRQLGSIESYLHKEDILDLAKENAEAIVDSGNYDLLKVYIELKRYETYLKGLIYNLKDSAYLKASKEEKKSFAYSGSTVNVYSRTKWDFSIDNKWEELETEIQGLKKKKKEREKYLKIHKIVEPYVDKETGEIKESFYLPQEILFGISIRF